jgi:hypothetical protein
MTWHTKLLALTSGVADAPDGTESPQGPRALATHTHTHTAECTICTGQVWRPPCRLDCAPHPTQPPMLAEGQGEGGWHPVAIKSRRLTAEQPWCCWTLEVWLSTCCPREFVQGHAICRSFPHYAHLLS